VRTSATTVRIRMMMRKVFMSHLLLDIQLLT